MANTITGKIHEIRPIQNIATKSGTTFQKRDLILDCATYDRFTGEKSYDNFPKVTFSQDKCTLLDAFQPGQIVTVSFDLRGSLYNNEYYNDIRGYKIELYRQQAASVQPMQSAPVPQPTQPNEVQPGAPMTTASVPGAGVPYNADAQQYAQYPQQAPTQPQAPQQPYPNTANNNGLPF